MNNGKLHIRDNFSKFGTLKSLREPIIIDEQSLPNTLFQCGRSVLQFSLKKSWTLMFSCFAPCNYFYLACYLIIIVFSISSYCDTKVEKVQTVPKVKRNRERLSTNYTDFAVSEASVNN